MALELRVTERHTGLRPCACGISYPRESDGCGCQGRCTSEPGINFSLRYRKMVSIAEAQGTLFGHDMSYHVPSSAAARSATSVSCLQYFASSSDLSSSAGLDDGLRFLVYRLDLMPYGPLSGSRA